MTSFVKHIAVLAAAFIATTALAEKTDDPKSSKTDSKDAKSAGSKKPKKSKSAKTPDGSGEDKKPLDVPVPMGHDSKGLHIPYYDGSGKRQMDFHIGVASRIDESHINMTNMQVETFNDEGKHEMQIDLPTSVYNTQTSAITTNHHVTITREDFEIVGEAMVFYTTTKQGGLGGGVRMLIYHLEDETGGDKPEKAPKEPEITPQDVDPKLKPDGFKTPPSRAAAGSAESQPDKLTPLRP